MSIADELKKLKEAISDALVCNKPAIINVDVDPKALYSFRKDSFKHRSKWVLKHI